MVANSAANTIVVGVDGSPSSISALRWAAEQARLRGIPLHVVTCWEFPVMFGEPLYQPPISAESLDQDARDVASKAIANTLGEAASELEISVEIMEGPASLKLLELAPVAEMIVVGSRGRGGFAGLLLGSVSQHLAEHAACPVVVVHESKG